MPGAFRIRSLLPLWCGLAVAGCGGGGSAPPAPPGPPPAPATFELVPVATGFTLPLDLKQPDDASGRLFVAEQGGKIQIILGDGSRAATPFLDVSGRPGFTSGGETGLLGLAFHPQYSADPRFFVNYTRTVGGQLQTVIAEFTASSASANTVSAATENILFTVDQPDTNHNGGALNFGPDGFLYIALGDGGGGGDPSCNGQNLNTLLGKILRIDVDAPPAGGLNYAIPAGNPFALVSGRDEIWVYGLRNPFRFSFDSTTGDLWIGDVGQSSFEEVDHLTAADAGANLGWNLREGKHPFPGTTCSQTGATLTEPVFDYDRSAGDETVIGGYVYRGARAPAITGAYVFGDFISGRVWSLVGASTPTRTMLLVTAPGDLAAFGRDQTGELYVARYSSGVVARIHQVGTP